MSDRCPHLSKVLLSTASEIVKKRMHGDGNKDFAGNHDMECVQCSKTGNMYALSSRSTSWIIDIIWL